LGNGQKLTLGEDKSARCLPFRRRLLLPFRSFDFGAHSLEEKIGMPIQRVTNFSPYAISRFFHAVKKTLKRKLNPKGKRKRIVVELKGQNTTFGIKEYFYKQLSAIPFEIYCVTLKKR
jgi:hypothetical protein